MSAQTNSGNGQAARKNSGRRAETVLVSAGRPRPRAGEPLNVPLVMASNFEAGHDQGVVSSAREYARSDGTAGWEALEAVLGELEGGAAVAFSSGMAAAAAVLDLLPTGSRVVAPTDCYTGVRALLADGAGKGRWQVELVDVTDTDATLAAARGAELMWLESPTNPLLDIADLQALCRGGRAAGALVAVDNTFATPLLQRPLLLGAHVVVHSATKFIGGHSDLLLGMAVAAEPETHHLLRRCRALTGATPGGMETFLALRGLRTMSVRLEQGQRSAGELAQRLHGHPGVTRVRYPGLVDDPGHERAATQMSGFGTMLSFELAGADVADAVCAAVRVIHSATSLGGVESTLERRAKLPGQEHVPTGLLRFSVGCEHVEDLWDDLAAALHAAGAVTVPRNGERTTGT
jgi:cystathionine gamma-synthase